METTPERVRMKEGLVHATWTWHASHRVQGGPLQEVATQRTQTIGRIPHRSCATFAMPRNLRLRASRTTPTRFPLLSSCTDPWIYVRHAHNVENEAHSHQLPCSRMPASGCPEHQTVEPSTKTASTSAENLLYFLDWERRCSRHAANAHPA